MDQERSLYRSREHLSAGVLTHTVQFASDHLSRLSEHESHWDNKELDAFIEMGDKVRIESSILCYLLARQEADLAIERLLTPFIDALEDCLHEHELRSEILVRRFPHTAMSLGVPWLCLDTFKRPSSVAEAARRALDDERMLAIERVPYRQLDLRWIRHVFLDEGFSYRDLEGLSVAPHICHPALASRSDMYALTHWVFYATDFGRIGYQGDPDILERIHGNLSAAFAYYLAKQDLDLALECSLAASYLDPGLSVSIVGPEIAGAALHDLGQIPSPSMPAALIGQNVEDLNDAERAASFRHSYHTTYVSALVVASALCSSPPDRKQQSAIKRVTRDLAPMERISELQPGGLGLPHRWLLQSSLTDAEVWSFIYDGMISDAMRCFELGNVLRLASQYVEFFPIEASSSSTVHEAVQLSRRLAFSNGDNSVDSRVQASLDHFSRGLEGIDIG